MTTAARKRLLEFFDAALRAVNGRVRVARALHERVLKPPVYLIAIGKAACAMARGALDVLGADIRDGFVVTKRGYAEPLPWPVRESGHPLPDEASLAAGAALIEFIDCIPKKAQVLFLLSGGASALVERLPQGMGLDELQALNAWLLASGWSINDMNALRRRVSLIKGGRLASRLAPRSTLALVLSDVPNDDLAAIGSGPLIPSRQAEALNLSALPGFLRAVTEKGTPMPAADDVCFRAVEVVMVGRLSDAKAAAAAAARAAGFKAVVHGEFVDGEATHAGQCLARELLESPQSAVHVWGGETTVCLPAAPGRGGRAQTLALSAACEFAGRENVFLLAVGTDGTDGLTEDAGALVDGGSVDRGEAAGLSAARALARADAGRFLEASGDLIQTGPTGTNVMDLMLGLRT